MIPNHQIISLTSAKGVGPRRIRAVLREFKHIDDISKLSITDLLQVKGISRDIASSIKNINYQFGIDTLENVDKLNGKYISYWDDEYPQLLQTIYDAPVGLFVLGEIPKLNAIGIVGTRTPTAYGRKISEKFSRELVQNGFMIASGMARGIDSISHHTAMKMGGKTIAVLGCGIDICYPPENNKLRELIIENGAIVSEYIPGTKPDAINFPKRNRIISGLSLGSLVVEAGNKSGAVITALNALDQNREVFVVPGRIDSKESIGCHRLIQQGAKLVTKIEDILEELNINKSNQQIELLPDLSPEEKVVYDQLSNEPIQIDDLCKKMEKDSPEILSILLLLELKNVIIQHPGKKFTKS